MIKYLGSKRALLPPIVEAVKALTPEGGAVCDLFSGTARVGHALKGQGFRVWSNDHNAYAHTLATAYVQADREVWAERAAVVLADLAAVRPEAGWFTRTFCEDARFFHPDNGARIDAMRDRIETMGLEPELKAIALVALMEAADRVDSTAGVHMAYMKSWAPRALKPLTLRMPELQPGVASGACRATHADALEIAGQFEGDLVYLDPPYNQHSYLGNYHCWESLVLWDKPETYGVANKRVDVRTRKSAFNSKPGIGPALEAVIEAIRAPNLIVSFNDEGYLTRDQLVRMLSPRGHVQVVEIARPRYVGARIGIHSPKGEKVGTVGRLKNVEYLFLVTERPVVLPVAADGTRAHSCRSVRMETHSFDATRNTYADRIGQRGYEASDTVTWRPTTVGRSTTIAANDGASRPETFREFMAAAPASVIIVAGGMVAAIVGAMLGGALHI